MDGRPQQPKDPIWMFSTVSRNGNRTYQGRGCMNSIFQSLDQKNAEILKKMESMLTQSLSAGSSALWHWEQNTSKIYISASYYLQLGFSPYGKEAGDTGLIDHIHPEDKEKIECQLAQAMDQAGLSLGLEFRSIAKSGEIIWMSLKGRVLCDDANRSSKRILGVISNISEYKITEKALAENERQMTTLMNNLPGMAYKNRLVKGKWKVEFVSNGVKSLLGYDRHFFMANRDRVYDSLIDPEDRERIWKTIDKCTKTLRSFELVYKIKTISGAYKWVWEKGEMILSETGSPVGMEGFMMDITTFKREEFRLQTSLKSANRDRYRFGNIIGKSPAMQKIYELINTAADSDANVIIYGESGTGKELVARAIHQISKRGHHPLIIVNCGAIPENLLESEFFGYKKGAFTGAERDKKGFLAAAEDGTLFLDEVGEISLEFQVKLLRVLDGHGYTPVGSNTHKKTNVRIIAATNRNLGDLIKQDKIRRDFYYRIHIIPITVPPLRKRYQDIPLLIDYFLEKYQKTKSQSKMPAEIRDALQAYHWPGNIRELENVVQRYVVFKEIEPFGNKNFRHSLPEETPVFPHTRTAGDGLKVAMEGVEKQLILKTLEKNKWRRDKTAKALKITLRTLYRKMVLHQIK